MFIMLEFIHKLTASFWVTLFLPLMALGNKFSFGLVQAQTIDVQNQTITGCGNPGNSNFEQNEVLKLCIEAINIELEIVSLWNNQEFEEAIFKLKQALTIWQQLGNKEKEGHILNLLAASYFGFNQIEQALPLYQQALEIYQQVDDPEEKMKTLRGLGSLSEGNRNYQQALNYYQEALAISRQVDDKCSEANFLRSIGGVYLSIAHPYNKEPISNIDTLTYGRSLNEIRRQALDYYYQALPLAHISSCHLSSILNSIGVAYQHLGQEQESLKFYQQALTESPRRDTSDSQASIRFNIAVLKRKQGNLQEALTDIQSAIDIVEDYRTYLISPEFRTTYFSFQQHIYETYIDILMQLHQQDPTKGYDAQAFYASERSRARSLIELLSEANVDIRQGVDPQLLEQERNLQEELDGIEKRRIELSRGYYSQAQADQIEQNRLSVLSKYKNLQDEIRLKSPNYGALQYPQPLTLTQVQQQILDKDTILLQYSLGEERSYLWAVTKDSITNYQLSPRNEIETAAKAFLSQTTYRDAAFDEILPASTQLTQLILPNLEEISQKRLLIVPDGQLHYIPFSGLSVNPSDYQPLLTKHQVIHLPSASTVAINRNQLTQRTIAPNTLAIIANPVFSLDDERFNGKTNSPSGDTRGTEDIAQISLERSTATAEIEKLSPLPFTRTEADTILELLRGKSSLGIFDFDANLNRVKRPDLSEYQIIHFATHGIFNSEYPELSGLVVSLVDQQGNPQNGFLRLNDIFNLNLPAELVVLSACQTGSGKNVKGEGIVGLTRGFMYAGAPRIIASLWNVNDASTAELMSQFYQKYLQENLPPAEALRQAQLAMWQSENIDWRNPYFWAAFTLQGEWR